MPSTRRSRGLGKFAKNMSRLLLASALVLLTIVAVYAPVRHYP